MVKVKGSIVLNGGKKGGTEIGSGRASGATATGVGRKSKGKIVEAIESEDDTALQETGSEAEGGDTEEEVSDDASGSEDLDAGDGAGIEGEEVDDDDDEEEDSDGSDAEADDESEDDEFERQSSSDEDEDESESEGDDDAAPSEDDELDEAVGLGELTGGKGKVREAEKSARKWASSGVGTRRSARLQAESNTGVLQSEKHLHMDDLSSDDEDPDGTSNTVGRIPLHWYDAYDHIGYNVRGEKVNKDNNPGDRIDQFLKNRDDPDANKTIYDMYNGRKVVLSERELEIIRRVQAGAFAHPEFDDTPDYVDYYSSQREIMPISAAPEPKRRFVPSKWEMMRVMKIVKAIKEGRYKDKSTEAKEAQEAKEGGAKPEVYLIWNDEEDEIIAESKRNQFHLPAPKLPLPGHAESYNPPAEYLFTEEEAKRYEEMDPSERPHNFIPKAHACLRHVAAYENFVKERFERCLDLYLCPRKLKRRLNIDPESLVPRLPQPRELKPFPNSLCMQFVGHTKAVRSIAVSPDGQFLASASEDGTVRLWEADTSFCRNVWQIGKAKSVRQSAASKAAELEPEPVLHVVWNPDPFHHIIAAVTGRRVVLINCGTADRDSAEVTESQLSAVEELADASLSASASAKDEKMKQRISGKDSEDSDGEEEEKGDEEVSKAHTKGVNGTAAVGTAVVWSFPSDAVHEIYAQNKINSGSKKSGRNPPMSKKRGSAVVGQEVGYSGTNQAPSVVEILPQHQHQQRGGMRKRFGGLVGPRVQMEFGFAVAHVAWHYKGDYLGVLLENAAGSKAVSVHQISKGKTQYPFSKSPGNIQAISFHPSRPFLFVATQQHVKVYHLVEQKLVKKLMTGCKWLSSIDIHPSGDHVIVGSYDRRVVWFDLDLSSTPYKTLKFHEKAVRSIQFHRRYPLMASAADDGNVHIFHTMVYSDLSKNPLIVPLKILRTAADNEANSEDEEEDDDEDKEDKEGAGQSRSGSAGDAVFTVAFHPRQPWIYTAGANGKISLYQDMF